MLTKSKNVSFLLLDFNEAPNSEIWIKESVWWRGFQFLNWGAFFARYNLAIFGAQHSESMTCRRLRRIYETSTAPTHSHHSSGAFLRCLSPESQFFPLYFNILWGCPFPWPSSALPTGPQISLGYDSCCCSCARKPPGKRSNAAVYQLERSVSVWLRQKNNETGISQLLANNNNGHWRKEYCFGKSIRSGATKLLYYTMTSLLLLEARGGCQPTSGWWRPGGDRQRRWWRISLQVGMGGMGTIAKLTSAMSSWDDDGNNRRSFRSIITMNNRSCTPQHHMPALRFLLVAKKGYAKSASGQ